MTRRQRRYRHKRRYRLSRYVAPLVVLAATAAPAAASDSWHGTMDCIAIPGIHYGPLHAAFTMTIDGARATYYRGAQTPTGANLGMTESGDGTVVDGAVKLNGTFAVTGYSFVATYAGRLDGGRAVLTGEQLVTAAGLSGPFHRTCKLTLSR